MTLPPPNIYTLKMQSVIMANTFAETFKGGIPPPMFCIVSAFVTLVECSTLYGALTGSFSSGNHIRPVSFFASGGSFFAPVKFLVGSLVAVFVYTEFW